MQKELIFIDFEEVYDLSEARAVPILRVLYDDYIPKYPYTSSQNVSIIYQKKGKRFVIYTPKRNLIC